MKIANKKISLISSLHLVKLIYRSILFLLSLVIYIICSVNASILSSFDKQYWLFAIIWIIYAIEMISRFFPSKLESMGCQKQFKRNYIPTGKTNYQLQSWKKTLAVIIAWVLLNSIFGILYYTNIIDYGVLILISLLYGVCDIICILFFCPFQTWIMKNRCCGVCRIYNWDFAMMFTPCIFIPHIYTWSLLGLSLIILIFWEIRLAKYPERFSEQTNASLKCQNCEEKLCHHKKQLQTFLKKIKQDFK